ncbi:MAG TPA: phage major capsid protein [Pseudonocardiaceae bacterium]
MTATDVIPTDAAELEEMLLDQPRMTRVMKDPAQFKDFIKNYANKCMSSDLSIVAQVREETQRVALQWLKEHGATDEVKRLNLGPGSPHAKDRGQFYNHRAEGAPLDGQFEHLGDFLAALHGERRNKREAVARMGELRNSFSSTIPSDGGFLVPEEFRAELLRVSLESAVVRPRARVIPMATATIKMPIIESASNAASVFGGIVGYWTEEQGQLVASSMKFGAVKLDANKLTAYTEIPNELLNDSAISVAAMLDADFPAALAWFEDTAFMRGTGAGEPLGWLHAGNKARINVAKEAGQAANTILWENVVKMFARMLPSSIGRSVWIANLNTMPQLATMAMSVGTGGGPIWVQNGADGMPLTILGRPIIFTEKAETLGTSGDLNFVDLSYYLIGDRQQMSAMTSEHFKFNVDTQAYRVISRVDGRPWLRQAITPQKGAETLSPFVSLATRG